MATRRHGLSSLEACRSPAPSRPSTEFPRRIRKVRGLGPKLADMADYKVRQIKDEQDLLIIVSTHGEGDPPPSSVGARHPSPFEYRFSPSPATIPLGRHLFSDWLDHLDVDDAERSDLLLVASELCSNAVRHASGTPGALVLRAWADGVDEAVEVEDDGAGFEL